ncbi:MAG TPA: hypothetical protein VKD21_05265 [Acidimicrobiales bacterium]|nr:hypothetical protein [Acidimicrobiales bacterium]
MTAARDPDDLASALLDGLLSDDEAAAARRDPAVAARLAELAAVRDAVRRQPRSPDPAARERGLAAALAAYDSPDEADLAGGGAVSPMRSARAARPAAPRTDTPWRPHGGARRRWLTAAAVVLAVVGVGILARNLDSGGDDDTSTAASESSSEGGESNAAADAGGGTDQTAPPSDGQLAIVDLGDVGSPAALAQRAAAMVAAGSSDASAGAAGGQAESGQGTAQAARPRSAACGDDAQAERLAAGGEPVVLRGRATLDGQPVDVWVVGASGDERVVAVDASCAVVVDQPLQD